jgi:hypothetical protein
MPGAPSDAVDLTWEELTARPLDFQGHRVRLPAWFDDDYEDTYIFPSPAHRDPFGRTALHRTHYAGHPGDISACARRMVFIEGTFDAFNGGTMFIAVASLWRWRVVSAPLQANPAPVVVRKPLPPSPDPDMVRIAAGNLPPGWRNSEQGSAHVEAFDIDRDETSAAAFRRLIAEGKVESNWVLEHQNPAFDARPLVCVSAVEAEALCRLQGKRLPTEQEWARAGFPLATTPREMEEPGLGCLGPRAGESIVPGKDDVTPDGVRNLAGSVEEWTASPHCKPAPIGCATFDRVWRGGASGKESAANRGGGTESHLLRGFRCAR